MEDGYEIQTTIIGQGGSGTVYDAVYRCGTAGPNGVAKPVAAKVVSGPGTTEAKVCELLHTHTPKHPNVVNIYGVTTKGKDAVIYMEKVRGQNTGLAVVPQTELTNVLRQIADGIRYLHNLGIAHLDIKPENIMLSPHNIPVIIDFGISWVATAALPHQKAVGSIGYIAPEILNLEVSDYFRADVFSLGNTFYSIAITALKGKFSADPYVSQRGDGIGDHSLYIHFINPQKSGVVRHPYRDKIDKGLYEIIEEMTNNDPLKRPNIDTVIERLERIG